jgi:hypothetical protein
MKNPEGLKDSECKKGQLSSWPPIPYMPPTHLLVTKESSKNSMIKLPNGTVFAMTIFSQGNTEEFFAQMEYIPGSTNLPRENHGRFLKKIARNSTR